MGRELRPVDDVPDDCFAYVGSAGAQQCVITLDFAPEERAEELPAGWTGTVRLSTHRDRGGRNVPDTMLQCSEGVIIG